MRWLYCNPDDDGTRATQLGCGWFENVPAEFANIATAPCVILAGAGRQVVLLDDGDLDAATVSASAQPLLDAENEPSFDVPAEVGITVDPQALIDAQAVVGKATTVKALREALSGVLDLFNPST